MMVRQTANYLALLLMLLLDVVMGAPFCKVDEGGKLMRGSCYCYRATDNRAEFRLACPSQLPPPVGTMKLEVDIEEAEEGVTGGKVVIRCYPGATSAHLTQYLTGLQLGNLKTVKFIECPVPQQSYSNLFELTGVTGVRRLMLVRSSGERMNFGNLTNLTSLQVERGPALSLSSKDLLPLSSLRHLSLQGLKSLTIEPTSFTCLPKLTNLVVTRCRLSSLHPNQFDQMPNLHNLSLHDNLLTSLHPGILDGAPNLQMVDLSRNRLTSLPDGLLELHQDLRFLYLRQNLLESLPDGLLAGKRHFSFLSLDDNGKAECPGGRRRCNYSSRIRSPLVLPPFLVTNSSIEQLSITSTNITQLPEGLLQGCTGLKVLKIQGGSFSSLPPSFFSSTASLTHLDLSYNSIESLSPDLFKPLASLNSLRLRANSISSLDPSLLRPLANLTHLDLSENLITDLHSKLLTNNSRLFNDSSNVAFIDFSNNKLNRFPADILSQKSLTNPSVETEMDSDDKTSRLVRSVSELRVLKKTVLTLGMGGRQFKRVMDLYTPWLGHTLIDLSGNRIGGEIEVGSIDGWLLDLSRNLITSVTSLKAEGEGRLILEGNPLVCNCKASDLKEVLMTPLPYVVPTSINCQQRDSTEFEIMETPRSSATSLFSSPSSKVLLQDFPVESLSCPITIGCPRPCQCTKAPGLVTVDCRSAGLLTVPDRLPEVPEGDLMHLLLDDNQMASLDLSKLTSVNSMASYHKISKLTMAGNLISKLDTNSLPNGLKHLDLRNNLLTEISTAGLPTELEHLSLAGNLVKQLTNENLGHFAREGLTVRLEGNPFLCSCSSSNLHAFLHEHYPSVDKFMNVTVACNVQEETEERVLYDLKEVELCEPLPIILLFLACGSFLVLVSFILVLHFVYRDTVVIWVFSKSWGKVFFSEDIVDRQKPYDAFLSYSHQDSEYVEGELLPGLESPENPREHQYRCLIHGRDWQVGAMIPDQILDSVASSRRTVVVLSASYLESTWSKMEFQAAHSKGKRERAQRVILVVHGELPPLSQMDEDLQKYIKANIAIHTDDPWFWQKLRYALPRKRLREKVRSPSCDTASTIASIPYVPQISKEGLLRGDFVT